MCHVVLLPEKSTTFVFLFKQPTFLEFRPVPKSKLMGIVGSGLFTGWMLFLTPN